MLKQFAFLGFAATVFVSTLLMSSRANAYCSASTESGTWVNPNAAQKTLARVEIKTTCENGQRGWKIRALTRCARTRCSWGYAPGVRRADGALAALFSTFTAERLVRMLVEEDSMKVIVVNVFRGGQEKTVQRYLFERHYK